MPKFTENDLCPGYRPGRTGYCGLCVCGLFWEGAMPAHDRSGRNVEHLLERRERRAKAAFERDELNRKLRKKDGYPEWFQPIFQGEGRGAR